jgi:hypothetical protein
MLSETLRGSPYVKIIHEFLWLGNFGEMWSRNGLISVLRKLTQDHPPTAYISSSPVNPFVRCLMSIMLPVATRLR